MARGDAAILGGLGACGICCAVLVVTIFVVLPSTFWIVAGNDTREDECNHDENSPSVNLSVWLIIRGGMDLLALGILLLQLCCTAGCGLCGIVAEPCLLCACCSGILMAGTMMIYNLTSIGWTIFGLILLINDELCHDSNPFLYNSTLSAVILGFIMFCFNCGATKQTITINTKNDEYNLLN